MIILQKEFLPELMSPYISLDFNRNNCIFCSDEMYQIVTYMPEDVPFNCRVCCPTRPSVWEILIRQEMQRGMRSVLEALVQCKSSSMLESFQGFEKVMNRNFWFLFIYVYLIS